jgi:hypothetical protein
MKTRSIRMLVGLVPVFLFAARAQAVTVLTTAPLFGSGLAVTCSVLNAGAKNVDLTIEVIDDAGAIAATSGGDSLLGSGVGMQVGSTGAASWCRITVKKGSAKGLRAAAFFRDETGFHFAIDAH